MPSNYAHYRFAQRMIDRLDPRVWGQTALYYAGCHGADPMFYYDAFHPNPVRAIADRYHAITGRELFTAACQRLRESCTDAAYAFLFGFLTHYCLDSTCHPFVNQLARIRAIPICGIKLQTQIITVLPMDCQKYLATSPLKSKSLAKLSKPMMEFSSTLLQPDASVSDVRNVKKIG